MNADEQTLAALNELEARLLADVELVRQMKARLGFGQPPPASAVAVASPAPAPAVAAPPPPRHPNFLVTDVKAAVRTVIVALNGEFGISEVKRQLAAQRFREFGDSTLRATLQELKDAGEIQLARRGIGRGGNRFVRPAPAVVPDSPPA
ncbi:MAG: hypothetical protein U1F71_21725 [Verrucomicrobiaceae bacterium]